MDSSPSSPFRLRELAIGSERAPLIVIDDAHPDAAGLARAAYGKFFSDDDNYYPGVRAKAPLSYQQYILETFRARLCDFFALGNHALRFTACHYSLVTLPPGRLTHLQRIPHIDSADPRQLAFVHYLFERDMGGTAFYRHRATGFEFVDESRRREYFECVERERTGPDTPSAAYIDGDTALYEQIARHDGVFNRMLIYRRNSLHSGCIGPEFRASANPREGRLSITGFLA